MKNRIPVRKIKEALSVPLIEIVPSQPQRRGIDFVILCPFHQEKAPSLHIYSRTNSFFCFGCRKGGDVINFVKFLYNFSFKEAVGWLIEKKGG